MNAVTELSPIEELERLEHQIEHGVVEVCTAFRKVHERELWRAKYPSFEAWLNHRFGVSVEHVRKMLDVQLPPRLKQLTFFDPSPIVDDVDIEDMLDRARHLGNAAISELAQDRSLSLRERAAVLARSQEEEERTRCKERLFARLRQSYRLVHRIEPLNQFAERIQNLIDEIVETLESTTLRVVNDQATANEGDYPTAG